MGNIHHANAKTTAKVRKEIQESSESIAALAARLSLNPKTVMKWKQAGRVEDAKSGPTKPRSTVLTETEEKIICEFRRLTLLPLDDVFISLRDQIPALTRSNLHRCLQRAGLSRLPDEDGVEKKKPKKFRDYDIGYTHVDITGIRLEGNVKAYLFVGIDRVCKYAYCEIHERMTRDIACTFLENFIADCPFKIHTVLTDNGAQFTYALLAEHLRPKNKIHPFDSLCQAHNIKHKLTKFRHPWTNGQVEVFNRTIKKYTTKSFHYDNIDQFKKHLMAFLLLYNHQRPLKALTYKTPYTILREWFERKPILFKSDPYQKILGLNK